MINMFRSAIGTWAARILVVLLVAAFAVFGINQSGLSRHSAVATVGDRTITVEQFARSFDELRRQSSLQDLTPEQAYNLGFHNSVLGQMAARAALLDEAAQIGIEASDDDVVREIALIRDFQNSDGVLDPERYRSSLEFSNMRVQQFEANMRDNLTENLITAAVRGVAQAPSFAAETIWRRSEERRDIAFITLAASDAEEAADPGDATLRAFYEEREELFTIPERRVVEVFWLRPEDRIDLSAVSDERARELYNQRLGRYTREERRSVSRLIFTTQEAAAAAAEALRATPASERAAAFAGYAETADGANRGVLDELGFVTRDQLTTFSAASAEALFAGDAETAQDAIVGPVELPAGWATHRIAGVQPGAVTPFEEVVDDLKREVELDEASRGLPEDQVAIEDQRAGGAPLSEIAEQEGARFVTVTIDSNGLDEAGAPVADLPDRSRVVAMAFPPDPDEDARVVGLERDLERLSGGGFFTAQVVAVIDRRVRPFNEVRDDALAAWREDRTAAALEDRAEALAERLRGGETLASIAQEIGADMSEATGLRRGQGAPGAPPAVATALFAADAETGAAAHAPTEPAEDGGLRRVLATLTAITAPDDAEAEAAKAAIKEQFDISIAEDVRLAFMNAALQSRQEAGDVTRDDNALRASIGVGVQGHGG